MNICTQDLVSIPLYTKNNNMKTTTNGDERSRDKIKE